MFLIKKRVFTTFFPKIKQKNYQGTKTKCMGKHETRTMKNEKDWAYFKFKKLNSL